MDANNVFFLENLEWFDESGQELVHRLPEEGSGEIKYGAQLTIRESQAGVFYYKGKAVGAFGPGRHTLKTANIPLTMVARFVRIVFVNSRGLCERLCQRLNELAGEELVLAHHGSVSQGKRAAASQG